MTTEIDPAIAAALGFPKLKYAWIERERRWLCDHAPTDRAVRAEAITDLYVTGTRLRLREARPLDGGPVMRRLARKADVDAATRLITSIYLTEAEFALLADLPGRTLRKVRHHLAPTDGVEVAVDVFEGALAGLILAEAEFDSTQAMAAFAIPDFALREVTTDPRYAGGALAAQGAPVSEDRIGG
jgi:CYTH domain-containing protein